MQLLREMEGTVRKKIKMAREMVAMAEMVDSDRTSMIDMSDEEVRGGKPGGNDVVMVSQKGRGGPESFEKATRGTTDITDTVKEDNVNDPVSSVTLLNWILNSSKFDSHVQDVSRATYDVLQALTLGVLHVKLAT